MMSWMAIALVCGVAYSCGPRDHATTSRLCAARRSVAPGREPGGVTAAGWFVVRAVQQVIVVVLVINAGYFPLPRLRGGEYAQW